MPNRPNFLFITTDQQRYDTIQALGARHMLTPHLNWLAETGVHFERGYSEAPVCVAARASMLTGRHFHRLGGHGWWGKTTAADETPTLPGLLSAAGYQTHGYGKFHYDPPRKNFGWEHKEHLEYYYRELRMQLPDRPRAMNHGLGQNEMEPVISTVHENDSLTRWIVERGIRFMEYRDESRPFCLYLGFTKPHPPFDPPLNYWQLYQNRSVPQAVYGDWSESPDQIPPGFMEATWSLNGVDALSPESLADVRRAYYACITHVDYALGLLFSRMRELGLLENTYIAFTSDHGEMLGDHHMGAKCSFMEPSAHVPYILRPAEEHRGLRGSRCDSIACMADILPTFTQLAGAATPDGIDGISLIDQAEETQRRDRLFGLCPPYSGVIDGSLKYQYTECGGELLFDLKNDPREQRDLIRVGTHADDHARLRRLLADEMEAGGWPFAENGELRKTREAVSRRQKRTEAWPGFHSADYESHDVLH